MVNPSNTRNLYPSDVFTMEDQPTEEEQLNEALRLRYKRMSCTKDLGSTIKANLDVIVSSIALASLLILIAIFAVVSHFASLKNPPPQIEKSTYNKLSNNTSNSRDIFMENASSHITDKTSWIGMKSSGNFNPIESIHSDVATFSTDKNEVDKTIISDEGIIRNTIPTSDSNMANITEPESTDINIIHVEENNMNDTSSYTVPVGDITDTIATTERFATTKPEVNDLLDVLEKPSTEENVTRNHKSIETTSRTKLFEAEASGKQQFINTSDNATTHIDDDGSITTDQNTLKTDIVTTAQPVDINRVITTYTNVSRTVVTDITENYDTEEDFTSNNISTAKPDNGTELRDVGKVLLIEDLTTAMSLLMSKVVDATAIPITNEETKTDSNARKTEIKDSKESSNISINTSDEHDTYMTQIDNITETLDTDLTTHPNIITTAIKDVKGIDDINKDMLTESMAAKRVTVTESGVINGDVTLDQNDSRNGSKDTTKPVDTDRDITTEPIIATTSEMGSTESIDSNDSVSAYPTLMETNVNNTTDKGLRNDLKTTKLNESRTEMNDTTYHSDINKTLSTYANDVRTDIVDTTQSLGGTSEPMVINTNIPDVNNPTDITEKVTSNPNTVKTNTADSIEPAGEKDRVTTEPRKTKPETNDVTTSIDSKDITIEINSFTTKIINSNYLTGMNNDITMDPDVITTQIDDVTKPNHKSDDISHEIRTKSMDTTEHNQNINDDVTTDPFVIRTQVADVTKPFDINGDVTTESNTIQTVTEFESLDEYYDDPYSAWNSRFLPKKIRPVHYQLHLDIFVLPTSGPCIDSGMYTGSVTITVRVLTATDFIVFHANDLRLNADRILILQSNVSVNQRIEDVTYNNMFEYYVIRLSDYLNEGVYDVMIPNFMGCITTSSELLLSSYKAPTGETR